MKRLKISVRDVSYDDVLQLKNLNIAKICCYKWNSHYLFFVYQRKLRFAGHIKFIIT